MISNNADETWRLKPSKWMMILGLMLMALAIKAMTLALYWGVEQAAACFSIILLCCYLEYKTNRQALTAIWLNRDGWHLHDRTGQHRVTLLKGLSTMTRLGMGLVWKRNPRGKIRCWIFPDQLSSDTYRSLAYQLRQSIVDEHSL